MQKNCECHIATQHNSWPKESERLTLIDAIHALYILSFQSTLLSLKIYIYIKQRANVEYKPSRVSCTITDMIQHNIVTMGFLSLLWYAVSALLFHIFGQKCCSSDALIAIVFCFAVGNNKCAPVPFFFRTQSIIWHKLWLMIMYTVLMLVLYDSRGVVWTDFRLGCVWS